MEWDQIVRLLSPPWLLSRCTVPIAIKPKLRNSSTSYDTLFTLFRHVRDYRPAGQMAKSIICSLLLLAFAGSVAAEDIEVFVVPHTHDDVGWIITMENYYTAEVQYIIDTMIEQLEANPARRFIYVEMAYLRRWWEAASEDSRSRIKVLHARKQLEFVLGGVVMADEAAASYVARINQLQEGHRFLLKNFGAIPTLGWQIDPFGSSRGTPTLFALDCFDALTIDRIPYQEKSFRQSNLSMEITWHGTNNLGSQTDMFTHIMDQYMYCTPNGFDWGTSWNIYDPPNPNPPLTDFNLEERAQAFVDNIKQRSQWYRTNKLLWPFGCDFAYQNALTMFKNMDTMIAYVNQNSATFGVNVKYAVLSDYFNAIQGESDWPDWDYDFFPYADNSESFWTGYFTSRNSLKILSRRSDSVLRTAEVYTVLSKVQGKNTDQVLSMSKIDILRHNSGVAQHHDAIAGTARPQVIADYDARLLVGINEVSPVIAENVARLASKGDGLERPSLSYDYADFASTLLENRTAVVLVCNSLGRTRYELVRLVLPPKIESVMVQDAAGNTVQAQVSAMAGGTYLFFNANVSALGFSTFFVSQAQANNDRAAAIPVPFVHTSAVFRGAMEKALLSSPVIKNAQLAIAFNPTTGSIENVTNLNLSPMPIPISQDLMWYEVSTNSSQPGGAYIFRNNGSAQSLANQASSLKFSVVNGPVVQYVEQLWTMAVKLSNFTTVTANATQVVSLVVNNEEMQDQILMDTFLGPVNGNNDIISRWHTPLDNNQTLFQDDSGFLVMKRYYNHSQTIPIPGNYYPMVSESFIQDIAATTRLAVLSAQSEGCGSVLNGALEYMLYRRTLQDDGRGVGAPLNETGRIHTRHWVMFDNATVVNDRAPMYKTQLNFPLEPIFGSISYGSISSYTSQYMSSYSAVASQLPDNVHLLHLQYYDDEQPNVVIRLQHLYQNGDGVTSPTLSQPVSVDLSQFFGGQISIETVVPRSLSANQDLSKCRRNTGPSTLSGTTVTLQPSEIATFFVTFF